MKPYSVEFNTGRTAPATQARLEKFCRWIHALGGSVSDTYISAQTGGYIVAMAQVWIREDQVPIVAAHHAVLEIRDPPKASW